MRRAQAAAGDPVPVTHRVDADRVGALPAVHQGQEMDKVQCYLDGEKGSQDSSLKGHRHTHIGEHLQSFFSSPFAS